MNKLNPSSPRSMAVDLHIWISAWGPIEHSIVRGPHSTVEGTISVYCREKKQSGNLGLRSPAFRGLGSFQLALHHGMTGWIVSTPAPFVDHHPYVSNIRKQ